MAAATYKPALVALMQYLDQPEDAYTVDTGFTQVQLGALAPAMIMRHFNFRAFEVPEPPEGHNLAPLVRSCSLKYWKKAISHFMPNKMMPWNELSGVGNPTRSPLMHESRRG